MPLAIACTNEEMIAVTVTALTASGRPAQLDGPIVVTVTSGSGTVLQDPATPNVFRAVSGDIPETVEYLVTGDADLGAGVVNITDTVSLAVGSATAANFGLVAGAAEPKA